MNHDKDIEAAKEFCKVELGIDSDSCPRYAQKFIDTFTAGTEHARSNPIQVEAKSDEEMPKLTFAKMHFDHLPKSRDGRTTRASQCAQIAQQMLDSYLSETLLPYLAERQKGPSKEVLELVRAAKSVLKFGPHQTLEKNLDIYTPAEKLDSAIKAFEDYVKGEG